MMSHPLDALIKKWPSLPPSAMIRNPGLRGDFLTWIDDAEPKHFLRLAYALGLAADLHILDKLSWGDKVAVIEPALAKDLAGIPDSVWVAYRQDRGRFNDGAFTPLTRQVQSPGPWLAHLSWNPQAVFAEGFRGTPEIKALSCTFRYRKHEAGYNFAFIADSFDGANHGTDDFYGDDAILFRVPYLPTYNRESADDEVLFWGPDADPMGFVHLTRPDGQLDGWSVVAADGEVFFEGGTIPACARWVAENELVLGHRLFGPRGYELRCSEDHLEPDDEYRL
jgi:hypothetical protein